jgi:hypothetical protein
MVTLWLKATPEAPGCGVMDTTQGRGTVVVVVGGTVVVAAAVTTVGLREGVCGPRAMRCLTGLAVLSETTPPVATRARVAVAAIEAR